MREQFEKLVKELCTLTKLPDATHVIDGGTMDVNGTTSRVSRARAALRKRFGTTPITEAA